MNIVFQDIKITFSKPIIEKKISEILTEKKIACIATINSNIIVHAYKRPEYKDVLNANTFNICDGSLLAKTISILFKEKLESYPGPDFFIDIISQKKYRSFFVGSTNDILMKLKDRLVSYDSCIENMSFLELPYCTLENFDYDSIATLINLDKPDFIWVSLGAPKQEEFSARLSKHVNSGLIVSVGAAFSFYSNTVKRAPTFIIKNHLEWFWRLLIEPKKTSKRLVQEIIYMPIIIFKELFRHRLLK